MSLLRNETPNMSLLPVGRTAEEAEMRFFCLLCGLSNDTTRKACNDGRIPTCEFEQPTKRKEVIV